MTLDRSVEHSEILFNGKSATEVAVSHLSLNVPFAVRWTSMSCVIIGFRAAPVVLVLCIFAANPLSSQVVGRVTDLNGTGLAGVTVDLWNSTMRIATAQTDRTGRYQFLSDVYRRGDLVTFRLIGYHPKSVRRTSLREARLSPGTHGDHRAAPLPQ